MCFVVINILSYRYWPILEPSPNLPFTGNFSSVYPGAAKVGGLQSQGVKGEIVVGYLDPLTTQDLKSSGFPAG